MNLIQPRRSIVPVSACGRLGFVAAMLAVCTTASAGDGALQYNRDIRPILLENCFACHGADSAARKANLRLDKRDLAIEAGAIVPGKPDESEALIRVCSDDPEQQMPPPKSKKVLTDAQKQALKDWISAGAEYEPHWSFIVPERPNLPEVRSAAWVRNPIDRFILAALEQRGLQPAPEADRRTLARRLSLDLIGLPPSAAEVEAFVHDESPDAYERYVDKLMDSTHWGEHRGRYWLDAARYADSNGIHFDNYREIWSYRDWVINAFNRNLTFDQFTTEQLAGDLLPNPTLEQRVATAFNRCNITTSEGGAIDEEYLVLYTRDRTETASAVWLGVTANCAVCHDHKFDPLSQKEFYQLSAFFNNTTQNAMDGNAKDTPPVVTVPRAEDRARWDAIPGELANVRKQIEDRKVAGRPDFQTWLGGMKPESLTARVPADGLRIHIPLNDGAAPLKATLDGQPREINVANTAWGDGGVAAKAFQTKADATVELADAGNLDVTRPVSFAAWVRPSKLDGYATLMSRMKDKDGFRGWDFWLENGRVGTHMIHDWPGNGLKVLSRPAIAVNTWSHVLVTYDGSTKAAGVKVYINGVAQPTETLNDTLRNDIQSDAPLKLATRDTTARLNDAHMQDIRVYSRALAPAEAENLAKMTRLSYLVMKANVNSSAAEAEELYQWWLANVDAPSLELARLIKEREAEQNAIKSRGTFGHVMQEKPGSMPGAFVLHRGEYDKRRDAVVPSTPQFLPSMPPEFPRNRLGLAKWLLRPEQPLTARVTVNRFWQELFGTGIVRTSADFGVSGELPTHPELLDWMAIEFREQNWDIKQFFKLLVTSATYRQSARTTPDKLEKDPQNRFLSRGPRFRMDAEMVRDYALASSGLLAPKIGGPSVKPYQPEGVWEAVAMIGSNTRDYRRDQGESLYRRSMYTFWKRAAPPASMDIFNAPNRETCAVRRERTNTPLQALVTLNDVQFVEAARHLAQSALKQSSPEFEQRIHFIAMRLLSRPLRRAELDVIERSLNALLKHYQANPEAAKKLLAVGDDKPDAAIDASQLAAWTMLTNEMMNLDEVLNK